MSVPLRYFKTESGRESKLLYFTDLIKYQLLLCFSNGLTDFVLRSKHWRSNSNRSNFSPERRQSYINVHLLENSTLGVLRVQRKCLPSSLKCRPFHPFNSRLKKKNSAGTCSLLWNSWIFFLCMPSITYQHTRPKKQSQCQSNALKKISEVTILKKNKTFVCVEREAGFMHRKVRWEH